MRNPFQSNRRGGHGTGGHEPASVPEGPPVTDNGIPGVHGSSVRSRLANLAAVVDGTRKRPNVDMRKLLFGFGIALIAAGIIDTILGWYGAAHSSYLFQEIPYLISGGLLGVCLVIGGGSLFVAGWIVRVLHENRRHTVVLARTIDQLERALLATTLAQTNGNGSDGPSEVGSEQRTEIAP